MTNATDDTIRAQAAVKAILDERDPSDFASILVTAEHAIASLLILLMREPQKAAAMLNEGLAPGVESRLALYNSKRRL